MIRVLLLSILVALSLSGPGYGQSFVLDSIQPFRDIIEVRGITGTAHSYSQLQMPGRSIYVSEPIGTGGIELKSGRLITAIEQGDTDGQDLWWFGNNGVARKLHLPVNDVNIGWLQYYPLGPDRLRFFFRNPKTERQEIYDWDATAPVRWVKQDFFDPEPSLLMIEQTMNSAAVLSVQFDSEIDWDSPGTLVMLQPDGSHRTLEEGEYQMDSFQDRWRSLDGLLVYLVREKGERLTLCSWDGVTDFKELADFPLLADTAVSVSIMPLDSGAFLKTIKCVSSRWGDPKTGISGGKSSCASERIWYFDGQVIKSLRLPAQKGDAVIFNQHIVWRGKLYAWIGTSGVNGNRMALWCFDPKTGFRNLIQTGSPYMSGSFFFPSLTACDDFVYVNYHDRLEKKEYRYALLPDHSIIDLNQSIQRFSKLTQEGSARAYASDAGGIYLCLPSAPVDWKTFSPNQATVPSALFYLHLAN